LILARSQRKPRGEWLEALGAPWLLPEDGSQEILVPGGAKVAATTLILEPVETPEVEASASTVLHWFDNAGTFAVRLPLVFNPSASTALNVTVREKIRMGERIPLPAGADMESLGTAIHACIALAFADRTQSLTVAAVERVLQGRHVHEQLSATAVLKQIQALEQWIAQRWGTVEAFAEYPVQRVLENGQVLEGRIDLLLKTIKGWVLIDHKSSPLGVDHWDHLAGEHIGQLHAYAKAIEAADGKSVVESWLFLPVAAGGVRVDVPLK
jgi:hypothetical protein